jgi:hypothetical protein
VLLPRTLLGHHAGMAPKLSDELRQALAQQPGQPLQVEDPVTHARYVLVRLDVYEQLRRATDYDASEPDPRSFYPAFAEAVKETSTRRVWRATTWTTSPGSTREHLPQCSLFSTVYETLESIPSFLSDTRAWGTLGQ